MRGVTPLLAGLGATSCLSFSEGSGSLQGCCCLFIRTPPDLAQGYGSSCGPIPVVFLGDLHKKVADQVQIGQRFSNGTAKVLRHLKNEPRRVLRCFPGPETNQQVHETLPLVGSRRHPRSQAERKRYGQRGQVAMKYQRSNW